MKKWAVLFFLGGMMAMQLSLSAQTGEQLLAEGKKLRDAGKEQEALVKFVSACEKSPNLYEALWNASFMMSRVGNRQAETSMKTNYFRNAKAYAERAIKANPNDAEGYYVMSVAMGRIALIAGSKEKVAASTDIKNNAMKATQLNPSHAGAWHVLGLWNYNVANLNFAERAIANTLLGGLPEGASNENAVDCIKKAIALKPGYCLYYYDLARCYQAMDKTDLAKQACEQCISMPAVTPDDPTHKENCKKLKSEL